MWNRITQKNITGTWIKGGGIAKRDERKGECDGKRLRQRVTTLRVALAQSTLAEETEEDTDAAFYAATGSTNKISLIAQIIEAFFK